MYAFNRTCHGAGQDRPAERSLELALSPRDRRLTLHSDSNFLIEDFSAPALNPGSGFSPNAQVVLPYVGAFTWKAGPWAHLLDANTTLLVTGGQEYRESHPIPGMGHASIVITPDPATLEELCANALASGHSAFLATAVPIIPQAQLFINEILRSGRHDALRTTELTIKVLDSILGSSSRAVRTPRPTTINRAKEVLHEHIDSPISLSSIAREVGVTPVYLTQAFRKHEGIPLYRYQTQIRLSRALVELAENQDLTELALDLGFSSHSHFTSAFRAMYGLTPSHHRADVRRGVTCLQGGPTQRAA